MTQGAAGARGAAGAGGVIRRWRPSLGFVLGGALLSTLGFAYAGLVALRYLGPEIGFRAAALLLGAVILLLTGALGWLLVRLLLRPITALEAYAVAHQVGDAATAPAHFGTHELQRTAQAVIAMAEALRDREATIRTFTDHVTHEIKTPVSTIRAAVELLEDGGGLAPEDQAILARINGAQMQIAAQLQALRDAAQAREVRYLGQCTLASLVQGLAGLGLAGQGLAGQRLAGQGLAGQVVVAGGADVPLPMAAGGMAVVLGHLARNAFEQGAAQVDLMAGQDVGGVWLRVADDGRGISAGNAGRVFDPFFTTGRAQGGTGMGLSIVRNMLAAHGGTIALERAAGPTTFLVCFPLGQAARP